MLTAKPRPSIYQLKITLTGIEPPIWRRRFRARSRYAASTTESRRSWDGPTATFTSSKSMASNWGVPEHYQEGDIEVIDKSKVPISRVLKTEGDSMVYVYDFGDDWRHKVVLEKILPSDTPTKPVCLAGERRCPPEDVGGPSRYQEFLVVILEPGHEEFEHYRQWAGNPVHAEEFDVTAVNEILERMRWPKRHRR